MSESAVSAKRSWVWFGAKPAQSEALVRAAAKRRSPGRARSGKKDGITLPEVGEGVQKMDLKVLLRSVLTLRCAALRVLKVQSENRLQRLPLLGDQAFRATVLLIVPQQEF